MKARSGTFGDFAFADKSYFANVDSLFAQFYSTTALLRGKQCCQRWFDHRNRLPFLHHYLSATIPPLAEWAFQRAFATRLTAIIALHPVV